MSGHNKWSKIKHQKGGADAARGQLFTKLGNAITMAVAEGGGNPDPANNVKLRFAIEKARSANMPKDNITRAIDRAVNKSAGVGLEALLYEGFGPGGAAILVEVLTDNKQRSVSQIKNVFHMKGGTMGGSGSVGYLFQKMGAITIKPGTLSEDDLLALVIEAGGNDLIGDGEEFVVYTNASDLHHVVLNLQQKNIDLVEHELIYRPAQWLPVEASVSSQIIHLLETFHELDDVQNVYTNVQLAPHSV